MPGHAQRAVASGRAGGGLAALALVLALLGCAAPEPVRTKAPPREFIVFFRTNDAHLTSEAQAVVAEIAARARGEHPAAIAIAGYGDGDTAHDAALADERASVVTRALVAAGVEIALQRRPATLEARATGIPAHKVVVTLYP